MLAQLPPPQPAALKDLRDPVTTLEAVPSYRGIKVCLKPGSCVHSAVEVRLPSTGLLSVQPGLALSFMSSLMGRVLLDSRLPTPIQKADRACNVLAEFLCSNLSPLQGFGHFLQRVPGKLGQTFHFFFTARAL